VTPPSPSRPRRNTELLDEFEQAEGELEQVLAVLRSCGVERPETLPLGEGDRALLAAHRELTGRDVELTVTCSDCGEVSSAWLEPEQLPVPPPSLARLGSGGGLREATYEDLLGLPADDSENELLRRCTVGAPGRPPTPDDAELVDRSLSGPLLIECVSCGARVEAPIDVERLVVDLLGRHLAEIDVEVHLLASRYGWALSTIESLPDARRRRLAELAADDR
jgi:hypothetical protein